MAHAEVAGRQLWYETAGDDGTPVLLVMGFGMSSTAWRPQVKALRQHHRVLAFDNRGTGRSGAIDRSYRMADLAGDAVGLLDHLGWDRAHVVGVSMGGMVAQEVALGHRHRVRSLTLIATHPGGLASRPAGRAFRLFARANTSRGRPRMAALRELLFPPAHRDALPVDEDSIVADFGTPIPRRTALMQVRAILRHDTRRRLGQLAGMPILIVRPEQDLLVPPRNSDRLKALMPWAQVRSFADAGHGVTWQCADALNARLLEHFRAADGRV